MPSAAAPAKDRSTAVMVLICEGVIVANAGIATLDPKIYGGLAVVLAPFTGAFCDGCTTAEADVGGVALGGLGLYNLTLDESEKDSGDIFVANVVALHVVAAADAITVAVSGDDRHETAADGKGRKRGVGAFGVAPTPRGGVAVSHRYRF